LESPARRPDAQCIFFFISLERYCERLREAAADSRATVIYRAAAVDPVILVFCHLFPLLLPTKVPNNKKTDGAAIYS
jgi:hypothetical protein